MAVEVVMPRLGWTMEVGRLIDWFKEDGEHVQAGELLFSVESDKAVQEVEALESGILRIPPDAPQLDEEVPVGTMLAYLVQEGELPPFETAVPSLPTTSVEHVATAIPQVNNKVLPARRQRRGPAISPRARRIAEDLGVDWETLEGSGRTGRIVEHDVRQAAQAKARRVKVSPVARRLAEEAGIDLTELAAQVPGKRVTREDVEAAIAVRSAAAEAPSPMPGIGEVVPITHVRRLIAQRMVESTYITAPLTLTTEADATELVNLREQLKRTFEKRGEAVPTYTDLVVKLSAMALEQHPMLGASWTNEGIVIPEDIHIGVAVDTEAGLLVPVIRGASKKRIQQISEEARTLTEKARARQLGPDDMQGGTFTVTNLGMYGIDAFTPIINLPQCSILGIGRIVSKPAVHNGEVTVREMVALSLTFDHRIVDGGPAARFLDMIRQYVEQPYLWLIP